MLQLINESPYASTISLLPNESGIDTLYVVVKATFSFAGDVTLAKEQLLPRLEDEFWGEPGRSSIRYQSEVHLIKPATDIVLIGHAYAPDGQEVSQMKCGIQVGGYSKKIQVFGDRHWSNEQISRPVPFRSMPLIYEKAFGGEYVTQTRDPDGNPIEQIEFNKHNPVGCGFCDPANVVEGTKLPNLEDPTALITSPGDRPKPVGFGFVSPTWKPRLEFAGTYDESWQKYRAPYLPENFSSRFFNAASSGLICDGYLQGGETVTLIGVCSDGAARFDLPRVKPDCWVKISGETKPAKLFLETVVFEPDDYRFSITWRAPVECDKHLTKIQYVHVTE